MIIAMKNNTYVYPHKHTKSESYHIIDGKMLLVYFKNNGEIDRFVKLSVEDTLIARVDPGQYHGIIVLSKYAIFHETRIGPFERENDSMFASWIEDDREQYMINIEKKYNEKRNRK